MLSLVCAGCGDDEPTDLKFPPEFRFGVATAATQIEDQNASTDWYLWTKPTDQGGLGHGAAFVGDAVDGYTRALDDIQLLKDLHVDSYRFSIEWARIEPQKGMIDEAALAHYSQLIDALKAAGIRPLVTIHHFSNPVWVADPRDPGCANGPSQTNLCGLGHPLGGPMVIQAMADHARLLAERFGDRVDDWGTINEPVNYLLAAYGLGQFPPGESKVTASLPSFTAVVRDYLSVHAAMYRAIKSVRPNASVGMSVSVGYWVPAHDNKVTTNPVDVKARDKMVYIYHHLWVDSLVHGTFDADLDGTPEEQHPDWQNTLDWLGVQYYSRMGVTGSPGLLAGVTPCFAPLDLGSCVPPTDPTFCVPEMGYETYAPGIYDVLRDFGMRYPGLPLVVSEAGLSTRIGERRAQNIVRILEQIARARSDGVDVRGYYHWSLMDNFEWLEGYGPQFGLYSVDRTTFARTPTKGVEVFAEIAAQHLLPVALRKQWGGSGPMVPEPPDVGPGGLCVKQ